MGLDVYEHEPAIHPGLMGHANVVLLPHLGSATLEARQDMGDRVIANILTFQERPSAVGPRHSSHALTRDT